MHRPLTGRRNPNHVPSLRRVGTHAPKLAVEEWRARGTVLELASGSTFVLDVPPREDHGNAPMLVLHGFPTCSYDWRSVLPELSRRRRVVVFDFVGFGLSAKPDARYSIRRYADQAEDVARATGLESVVLLTHDMGDTVGGELLARDLEGSLELTVEARVLTNGSIYIEMAHLTTGQEFLLALSDERADVGGIGTQRGAAFKQGLAGTFSAAHPASDEELDAQWELAAHNDGHTLLPRTIRYIEDRRAEQGRFTGAIERHPSSLGVVWGAEDPVAVHAMTARLLEARPDARLVTLDGVAHYPMIEDPAGFAAAVHTVLD
jgi:pimeloyl-ACP methyl ester carboxylesterase